MFTGKGSVLPHVVPASQQETRQQLGWLLRLMRSNERSPSSDVRHRLDLS